MIDALSVFYCEISQNSGYLFLNPKNVLLSEIYYKLSITKEIEKYDHRTFTFRWKTDQLYYQSPEMLRMARDKPQTGINLRLSDLFSLGMIALQLLTNFNIQSVYDLDKYEINTELLKQLLQQINTRQYAQVTPIISALLDFDPKNRTSLEDL